MAESETFRCDVCGQIHEGPPLSYGFGAPLAYYQISIEGAGAHAAGRNSAGDRTGARRTSAGAWTARWNSFGKSQRN